VNNDRTGAGRAGGTRVTQREAAERLGVTVEAIRKRVARGTLRSDKGEDGRRYVYLDTDPDAGGPQPEPDTLTSELRDRLRYVEGQLEAERQAHGEARRLLAAALERMPAQLEAPQEPPEPTEAANASSNSYTEQEEAERAMDPEERRYREARELALERMNFEEGARRRQAELAVELETRRGRRQIALGFLGAITAIVVGSLGTVISAGGETFGSTISSVFSAITGDQAVTIASALIGLAGTIGAAYLTVRLTRRRTRNQ
jgi:pyruvate/2-oxoglutarate dehydrogenase complex dihydrolipoamide acyltransferase (E2) component